MHKPGHKSITVSEWHLEMAKKKADKDHRSVSNYIENLIEDDK